MRISFLALLITNLISTTLYAGSIKGSNNDAVGPLPSADVILYRGTDTTHIYKHEMCDENGIFEFTNLKEGRYILKAEYLGFKNKKTKITLSKTKPQINALVIRMNEDAQMLDMVQIKAEAMTLKVEADKKSYMVNESSVSEGTSVSDLLSDVPSVAVDGEGNISMRNSENVEVFINGKPSGLTSDNRAEVLEQLPAGSVQKVEVITNPGAKYNAEGQAGIINIVMKNNHKKGYNMTLNGGLNIPTSGKLGENVGANINYSAGKWDLNGGVSFQRNITDGERKRYRRNFKENGDTLTTRSDADTRRTMTSGLVQAGANYKINKLNEIGVNGMVNIGQRKNEDDYDYTYGQILQNQSFANRYGTSDNSKDADRNMYNASMDYLHRFRKEGEQLSASASWGNNYNSSDAVYLTQKFDSLHQKITGSDGDEKTHEKRTMNQYTLQTDYVLPLDEKNEIEAGLKADFRNDKSNSNTRNWNATQQAYIENDDRSNDFNLQQNIYAGYADWKSGIGKRFKYNIGLRAELTDIDWNLYNLNQESDNDPYIDFFPSAYINYTLSEDDELQLGYNKRISRPGMRFMNPNINATDSTNLRYGNPDLDPEITHAIEFNWIKTTQMLKDLYTLGLYYKRTNKVISSYSLMDGNVLKTTYGNLSTANSEGVEVIAKNHLGPITLTTNLNVYYYQLDGGNFSINKIETNSEGERVMTLNTVNIKDKNSFSWTGKITANVQLPWQLKWQIVGDYSSRVATSQGHTMHRFVMNTGLSRSFLNKKMNVNLNVRDLLNTNKYKDYVYSDDYNGCYDQENDLQRAGTTFNVSVSYSIGNMGKMAKEKEDVKPSKEDREDKMDDD